MMNRKSEYQNGQSQDQINKSILKAVEMLVRMLGLINGTFTIHIRGGQISRAIEVINKVDVSQPD